MQRWKGGDGRGEDSESDLHKDSRTDSTQTHISTETNYISFTTQAKEYRMQLEGPMKDSERQRL